MDWIAKLKLVVFPLCLVPLAWLVNAVTTNQLGPDPANTLTRDLGEWALIFLCMSLAVTPARKITGINKLIRFRRMIGLFSLFYAVLHVIAYLAFMLGWQWQTLLEDLYQRPYIIVGAIAILILSVLGVTSTKSMMRRLGKKWAKLHKLVYLAAGLAILHFVWLSKSDYTEVVIFGSVVAGLMLFRIPIKKRLS
ncbi:protein-methionine-sulfoxide reductase heme-binding subunit MsrQ [Endozoicomonas numazuensis]|uniref:Protein-methionine-sulfoxide reductase heme-binding subunit MsrQ n=1 Tax=Endozoicomonas numazuensis TaxID=1137799 RepID=A0A081NI64_9GAMM|nr:protein-methionine-sulfoxide reductase heme-binding subunit MsrQ [Endozoicomonas numazuensis]KEQ18137.1 ferric reductase [Endozoicomonas numazuensis]